MSLTDGTIDWHAPAHLKRKEMPANRTFAWIGDSVHYGTVAEVIWAFRMLPPEEQIDVEMFTDAGVIAGMDATIFACDALLEIAAREDVPAQP